MELATPPSTLPKTSTLHRKTTRATRSDAAIAESSYRTHFRPDLCPSSARERSLA